MCLNALNFGPFNPGRKQEEKMKYQVSYILEAYDGDGPMEERRQFEANDDEEAKRTGREIAEKRAADINHSGGLAMTSQISVRRFRRRAGKRQSA